jgi:cobalt/nickel transport protein
MNTDVNHTERLKMKKVYLIAGWVLIVLIQASLAGAHFGMVIPSDNMVMQQDPRTIKLQVSFSHPMEMVGMEMVKPKIFEVITASGKQNLAGQLKAATVMGKPAWKASFPVKRPGLYVFCAEPQPYWEPAEDCYIVHYTKTVVTAFGDEEGWDRPVGLKTEIVPLTKPYGLYAGNLFQGVVHLDGKAVPYAEVEIEFYNQDRKFEAPTDYMVTQTIKADANGVFSYAAPAAGWWGFAALSTSDKKINHDGKPKDVEIGAVIWVRFESWAADR